MYILFEGIDTSGKSTQIDMLVQKNPHILATKEPGGTEFGEILREMILNANHQLSHQAEFFLFLSDRAEHYDKIIKPNKHKTIISDRGFISGMSYAFCNDEQLHVEFLLRVNAYAMQGKMPDKIVFFETNKKLLMQRMDTKKSDNIEQRGLEYLLRVQYTMKKIIEYIDIPTLTIDANDTKEKINRQIEEFIK